MVVADDQHAVGGEGRGVEPVALMGRFLLHRQQRLARFEPFLMRDDLMVGHGTSSESLLDR